MCPRLGSLAWHDFPLREVASEEVVICSDILIAHCILLRNILHNPIHQQEREPACGKGV